MEIPDKLVEDFRFWTSRDRFYAKVGDRTINARKASDSAHAAGQRILEYILDTGRSD